MAPYKRLPYGISDFHQIITEGLYYVDKTMFIERMELAGHFLFLIRPRRFGKSIFLSSLRYYYDINEKDNFQKLFDGLWIAAHPTPEQGEYQVMFFDYSRMGSNIDNIEANFYSYCAVVADDFADRYEKYYFEGFDRRHPSASHRGPAPRLQSRALGRSADVSH